MLAWLLHVRVCATNGLIDFVVYNLPAGVSATRWPVFVALGLLETATMYLVGTFCITRLRLLTPGRETAAEDEHSQQANSEYPDKGALVIAGLGGKRMSVRWATVLPVCGLMCGTPPLSSRRC